MKLVSPKHWKDYELIDCGNFEKLERFGQYTLIRPEPQAVWDKVMSDKEWKQLADATFDQKSSNSGEWIKHKNVKDNWNLNYASNDVRIKFKMALTRFKHVGIFPEQADNWEYIYSSIKGFKNKHPKVLNLFAYTGGASLAAKAAGADVVHVDSVKQVISWAKDNMELSNLKDIRWTVEDALKFVKREVKRGKTYNGIILDPPAYGIGAKGERWKLEESINEMLSDVAKLLDKKEYFLVINTYSLGFSALIIENLLKSHFPNVKSMEIGETLLYAKSGVKLPLGVFGRFNS